jgi:hypothetical protein
MSKKMSIVFLLSASLSTLCMDKPLSSAEDSCSSKSSVNIEPKSYMGDFGPIDIAMIKMRISAVGIDGIRQEMQETESRCIAKQEAKAKSFYVEHGYFYPHCRVPDCLKIKLVCNPAAPESPLASMIINKVVEVEQQKGILNPGQLGAATCYSKKTINGKSMVVATLKMYRCNPLLELLIDEERAH